MIPQELNHLLGTALTEVRAHPHHALLPLYRQQIYTSLGSISTRSGHQRRARLALLAAARALPVWQQERPDDDRAERLLAHAKAVLSQEDEEAHSLLAEAKATWQWLMDDDLGRDEDIPSVAASDALSGIVRAAFVVAGYDVWDDLDLMEHDTDSDIDTWTADTAIWAANAIAGRVWSAGADVQEHDQKYLDYWIWWLTEAVPAAWAQT